MDRPKVGLGVLIVKDNMVLLGKRKNSHGDGSWCPPGGHLEFGESFEECAKREVLEECGLSISNLKFVDITNDIFKKDNKHYVTIHMKCDYESGEPKFLEPHKCEKWEWFSWDNLPSPLFLPIINFKEKYPNFKQILEK